jgi:hypothetical protein
MAGGNSFRVRGTPEEIERAIKAASKDCTYHERGNDGLVDYTYVDPAFMCFELEGETRRQLRVRSAHIEGITGV